MAFLNYAKKEISAKIVYYGPGLSGKTTNLEWIHRKMLPERRGKLISLETRTDRTLFFDFLPVQFGEIRGFQTRFNVYTVPGQIFYNETRKMVLKGVDGIVFIADSQKEMSNENVESLRNLEENLRAHGKKLHDLPLVFQYNKRDLSKILSVQDMNRLLNPKGLPFFEAVAIHGDGVLATLTRITRIVAEKLQRSEEALLTPALSSDMPSIPDSPSIPVIEPKKRPPPRPAPPPEKPPAFTIERGLAEELPVAMIEDEEPAILATGRTTAREEPEPESPPVPALGPIVEEPDRGGPLIGDEMPRMGDLSTTIDLFAENLHSLRKEPPPKEARQGSPGGIQQLLEDARDDLEIDPSIRLIPKKKPEPYPQIQTPEIRVGNPEKVDARRVSVPVSVTFPDLKRTVSFEITVDLKVSTGARKK